MMLENKGIEGVTNTRKTALDKRYVSDSQGRQSGRERDGGT